MSFNTVLERYRKVAFSERDKGTRFECLMKAFLKTYPIYQTIIRQVYLWSEFPCRTQFGGKDTGIDLVIETYNDKYWAVQCKCYQETTRIDKPEVDTFLSTSGKHFKDLNGNDVAFSHRLWISTTNKWTAVAEDTLKNQIPAVQKINLTELENAPVDWEELDKGLYGEKARVEKKNPRPHQKLALAKAHEYYETHDRGKLIMACGTGKTFTSLKIAEQETNNSGLILFLVPSIALLGQTLNEWVNESEKDIHPICICSDPEASRKRANNNDDSDTSVVDLALPASTNVKNIKQQFDYIKATKKDGMTVVFSTYQSIDVIAKAQAAINAEEKDSCIFDMIICDEAHRTTGVILTGAKEESAFTKVHDDNIIKAKKRMYMTATPRLYNENAKEKAKESQAILCSMDDPVIYGEEFYRIGFGEAVEKNLLSDYKVLVLTLTEDEVPSKLQEAIANPNLEINTDDATKLVGCINALSKRVITEVNEIEGAKNGITESDPNLMHRAVAFCPNIKASKKITEIFNVHKDAYYESLSKEDREKTVTVVSDHIDGSMGAALRDEKLSWLKNTPTDGKECRILTNVRCLSEGVDVPSLDAVMFLSARNSQVDVVQSVGRVMRRAEGKKYGYIIIPVVIPADVKPEEALNNNEKFKVVWTVLNALRAHDDRFNATVNKIELNKKKDGGGQILVGRPDTETSKKDGSTEKSILSEQVVKQLILQFGELQGAVYAKMVQKVGSRKYWEQWAKDIAEIAQKHVARITKIINKNEKYAGEFNKFLNALQKQLNPSINEDEAIEMLAQHIITRPVFEALFENYSFIGNNSVSIAMQKMLDILDDNAIGKEENDNTKLDRFYKDVRERCAGIDNAEGKQRVIIELYDKFFKTALPKTVEKLGIVYTPVEVVDFILQSVSDVLKKEFNRTLSDENLHILDPFTGTGTFITRLLQGGYIKPEDLKRKYEKEIHANEIVLLAYYIASINIENAYHDLINAKEGEYQNFEGICLTDTFQLNEYDEKMQYTEVFPRNSKRVEIQKKCPLTVIIGNPPYSVGQKSENDNAKNQKYKKLDSKIADTYVRYSNATLNKGLYDSYIKAFRWASDRLDKTGGIIGFVSNGSWLDTNGMDGFRHCLETEFSSIYVYNLRGNQRTSGELSRKEGGKIFGSGSRTPIAITLLVKNPKIKTDKATIYYHDIGDYLSREEKLNIIKKVGSVASKDFEPVILKPNEHNDWLNQRNDMFESFILIYDKDDCSKTFFNTKSNGIASGRDYWVYNFSQNTLNDEIDSMLNFYNEQRMLYTSKISKGLEISLDMDATKISWTDTFIRDIKKNIEYKSNVNKTVCALYRPFVKMALRYDKTVLHRTYQMFKLFPDKNFLNKSIIISGLGASKDFSALITDLIPNYHTIDTDQCFPLYWYEEVKNENGQINLFNAGGKETNYKKHDGITDFIWEQAKEKYGHKVTKEDIFYYVYGILHSKDYRETFAADLKKMLPRIPLVDESKDFTAFSQAGRDLAKLHLNYENQAPLSTVKVTGTESNVFTVEKMRFKSKDDKSEIIYNGCIRISNIPKEAYDYIVNGKSAIEWIMERYQITIDKASQIKNDPNDWAKEHNQPRYILDLLLSVISMSVATVKIVNNLPKLNFKDEHDLSNK